MWSVNLAFISVFASSVIVLLYTMYIHACTMAHGINFKLRKTIRLFKAKIEKKGNGDF